MLTYYYYENKKLINIRQPTRFIIGLISYFRYHAKGLHKSLWVFNAFVKSHIPCRYNFGRLGLSIFIKFSDVVGLLLIIRYTIFQFSILISKRVTKQYKM